MILVLMVYPVMRRPAMKQVGKASLPWILRVYHILGRLAFEMGHRFLACQAIARLWKSSETSTSL